MKDVNEQVSFSYEFCDKDDGTMHEVRSAKKKDAITASELCEMFVDFMASAGYSVENVFNYFENGGY